MYWHAGFLVTSTALGLIECGFKTEHSMNYIRHMT